MSRFDEVFRDMDPSAYYPGSKQRRDQPVPAPESEYDCVAEAFRDLQPRRYQVNHDMVDFFTIGQLAQALGRSAVTLRKWESDGTIPKATFLAPNPKKDPRARRRLYSRSQAEGIVRIAHEEHIIGDDVITLRRVGSTNFTKRVIALFRELQSK